MTGSLSFAERAELTPEAQAIVVLVEHSGNPITAQIIESQVIPDPGQVPIAFELPYTTEEIDPEALYTVSAAIVDGTRLWASDDGTRVITYGNPTEVDLELVLQSDLLKGQVTGEISGTDVTLAGTGFAAAVVFDETSQVAVGTTVVPAPTGVPIAFSVPFDPAEIDAAAEYVVVAAIVEGDSRWANRDGVPVITNDNPLTDVIVPVTAVTPPDESWGPFGLGALGWLIVLAIIGAIIAAVIWYWRSRQAPPPDDRAVPRPISRLQRRLPNRRPSRPPGEPPTASRVDNRLCWRFAARMEAQRFTGRIRYWNPDKASGLAVVDIPPEHVAPIGGLKQVRVHGTIGTADFTSNVMPAGGGRLALSVSKAMMTSAGVGVGDVAEFAITRVGGD